MFGDFAKDRQLLLFQSGHECENWIDPLLNIVYKMNMLTHVGEDILKLLDRVDLYNMLFPEVALRLVGFQVMGSSFVYPVFAQPFIDNVRFASEEEIKEYMESRGFLPTEKSGEFIGSEFILSDIKPKNVLRSEDGAIFVIDAEVSRI